MNRALFSTLLFLVTAVRGLCFDSDALREPIVRPNAETLKRWMYNQVIIIHKHSLWFDTTAQIEPSKVASLAAQGGFVYQKPPPFANYATSIWTFEYPDEKGNKQKYTVTATYYWGVALTGIDRTLSKMIITGP